jgi:hypothetical protein
MGRMGAPRNKQEQDELDAINHLGKQCVELFHGYDPVVMCNVAASMLVGAIKASKLELEDAHNCVDSYWDSRDGGAVCRIGVRPS